MNLTSIKTIKELLKQHNLKPLKRMGQNFIISGNVVDNVVSSTVIAPTDTVLEIGPGLGALTIKIAKKAKQVIAVEKDSGLVNILRNIMKEQEINNIEVVNADILKCQIKSKCQMSKNYKLIANLPYNIATAVIMQFLEAKNPPQVMVVMLQKEVAKRVCAKPPHMSKLAVFSQFYSIPKILGYVSKRSFYPQPKVDSAVLKITPHNNSSKEIDEKLFTKIVKAGFAHPRKQLVNNLSKGLQLKRQDVEQWLSKNNIKTNQRAETLTVNNWIGLVKTLFLNPKFKT